LASVAETDSLTVRRKLVANTKGLYPVPGRYSIAAELRDGRLQASQLVKPELIRHTTWASPKQGKPSPACRVVAEAVQLLTRSWGNGLTETTSEVAYSKPQAKTRRSSKGSA
jgi:hypothetical protein